MYIKKSIMLGFILLASGCHNNDNLMSYDTNHHKDETTEQLVQAAQSVEQSLNKLALTQTKKNKPLIAVNRLITPEAGLGKKASIDWTGPVAPLLHKISKLTAYRVKTLGRSPAIPIVVSITQQKAMLADIIKNADLQAGNRASIMVYPEEKIIELRYNGQ